MISRAQQIYSFRDKLSSPREISEMNQFYLQIREEIKQLNKKISETKIKLNGIDENADLINALKDKYTQRNFTGGNEILR